MVTGASGGIGEAVARQLASEGTDLVLVARNREALETLAAELGDLVAVEVCGADLGDDSQLADIEHRLVAANHPIDLLVNNAGVGIQGAFAEADLEEQMDMVAVNALAVLRLTHAAARAMQTRGGGSILNVSSMAGFGAHDGMAVYCATKSFVTTFSEALAKEMAPAGVRVTVLCPGLTRTDFHERAGMDVTSSPELLWQSAEEVARVGLDAAADDRVVVVPGLHNRLIAALMRHVPRSLVARVRSLGRRRSR